MSFATVEPLPADSDKICRTCHMGYMSAAEAPGFELIEVVNSDDPWRPLGAVFCSMCERSLAR